jgi:hypothetical protein
MSGWLELFSLLGLVLVAIYWSDALRSLDHARTTGRRACMDAGVQFLDDSVALARLRLRRDARGSPAFWREYRFEYSTDGTDRHPGYLIVHGKQTLQLSLNRQLH